MSSFSRILSGLVLGFYLALIGIQTFHTHAPSMAADPHAECRICKIAHQSPSLINPPVAPASSCVSTSAIVAEVPGLSLQVVFRSYGPAPPTA